jgi:hypothetical protein
LYGRPSLGAPSQYRSAVGQRRGAHGVTPVQVHQNHRTRVIIKVEMRRRNQGRFFLRTLPLVCLVLSLASLGGNVLQVSSRRDNPDHPLSRRELSTYSIPPDAIAARGQSFSSKLCKNQRPQLDQAIAGNAPKLVFQAARIAPIVTCPFSHSSGPASFPPGRAPPRLA